MTKKALLSFTFIIFLTVAVLAAAMLGVEYTPQDAEAAAEGWSAKVAVFRDDRYVSLYSGAKVTDTTELVMLVAGYEYVTGSFKYAVTDNPNVKNTEESIEKYISDSDWTTITDTSPEIIPFNDGVTYRKMSHTVSDNTTVYIFFCREYTQDAQPKREYYDNRWQITVNKTLGKSELGIAQIDAYYFSNNIRTAYQQNRWIGTELTFEITTDYMQSSGEVKEFDSRYELLSFSIDGLDTSDRKKLWTPIPQNKIAINTCLENARVDFRLTDIAKNYTVYSSYSGVYIDTTVPVFDIVARATDANGEEKNYEIGSWSCSPVVITCVSKEDFKCISGVTYKYSTGGDPIDLDNGPTTKIVEETTEGLRFYAISGAGVEYYYQNETSLTVRIDDKRPHAVMAAYTPDPDREDETAGDGKKILKSIGVSYNEGVYTAISDANGEVEIRIYNKGDILDEEYIANLSAVNCYYAVSAEGGEYGSYQKAAIVTDSNDNTYYRITESVAANVVSAARRYKFYLQSEAGLKSNDTFFDIKILGTEFSIEVQPITYATNKDGWASEAITVYVIVPTDSKIDSSGMGDIYTIPTTKYTFCYYAETSVDNIMEAEGKYHDKVDNTPGKSIYKFLLAASANSRFHIYAKNGAGKRSETYKGTEIIKIDILEPEAELTAVAYSQDGSNEVQKLEDGQWTNGQVRLILTVKNSVSGVHVKKLRYSNNLWQEEAGEVNLSSPEENNGATYFYHYEMVSKPSDETLFSRTYGYRVYTRSGKHKDLFFDVNIDTSSIMLSGVEIILASGEKKYISLDNTIEGQKSSNIIGKGDGIPSVCEDFSVKLYSNPEQLGHFGYKLDDGTPLVFDDFEYSDTMSFTVPADGRGVLTRTFYLVSQVIDYQGRHVQTTGDMYTIEIPFNTLNISISYQLIDTNNVNLDDGQWHNSDINVEINIMADDVGNVASLTAEERNNYKYYYTLIDRSLGATTADLKAAIAAATWKPCGDGGKYKDENDPKSPYAFTVSMEKQSFYGYIALSVTNEAGFRSSTAGEINKLLRIDRTDPDVDKYIIEQQSGVGGEKEYNPLVQITTYYYYSKDPIVLKPKQFDNKAELRYKYIQFGEKDDLTQLNYSDATKDMWLDFPGEGITLNVAPGSQRNDYNFLFYIENTVGSTTGGDVTVRYKFIIDTSAISGNLEYDQNSGGYFDQSLKMYTFMWQDSVSIFVNVKGSNTPVKYQYSVVANPTDEKDWIDYKKSGSDAQGYFDQGITTELVFDAPYFANLATDPRYTKFKSGVNAAFSFRVINKAGTVYRYNTKVYIAIDRTTPEFNISLGDYVSDPNKKLDVYSSNYWSNKPVTIEIIPIVENVSGVKYTYTLLYAGADKPTDAREVPAMKFTTDRLDGFDTNRDVILTIIATSRADSSIHTDPESGNYWRRIKVDQAAPEFMLTGFASQENDGKTIVSGEWTKYNKLEVIKTPVAANSSRVLYNYTYTDTKNTNVKGEWSSGNLTYTINAGEEGSLIGTVTVEARSDAGLTYTQKFYINMDNRKPEIKFFEPEGGGSLRPQEGEECFIDLKVYVEEENIEICEYITDKSETRGFAFDPMGAIISTSSVDNTIKYEGTDDAITEYRGYVKIYVKDYAGNEAFHEFYMLPFKLNVNNVTLSANDRNTIQSYKTKLDMAKSYMEDARVIYFENLISRLEDRIHTLENEIATYQAYLTKLSQRTSFELKSDYQEMYDYLETYNNYAIYGQAWIQDAIKSNADYIKQFENLQLQFSSLQAQMDAVFKIEDDVIILPAINMVEAKDYNDILRVYDAYSDLTHDQKACFNTNLYTKLLALKKKCEVLLLADEDTGVSLDAEFAPGAKIKVETFSEQSEYYTNAQSAIYNTITDNAAARAVVSIYRVSLTGSSSQTNTGSIVVNMPIPEDYRQYVKFAVYEMSLDGTITPIDDMKIAGDGKSVTFTSSQLSTYILTTRANIEVHDSSNDGYGTFLGLTLDVKMIKTIAIIAIALFAVMFVVVLITGIRHRRFLNTYNRAYRGGIYRRGIQRIPKGNTTPRRNPLNTKDRVREKRDAF